MQVSFDFFFVFLMYLIFINHTASRQCELNPREIKFLLYKFYFDRLAYIILRKLFCYSFNLLGLHYFLQITVTFQYEWLDDMFREMTTFVFFVMTGYKFRPATNNPYFSIQADDDELEMDKW